MKKIFAIGFQKTGTTSLAFASRMLGRKLGNPSAEINKKVNAGEITRGEPGLRDKILQTVFEVAEATDGLNDSPGPFVYEELQERYPDAKFIMTYRDPDKWIESLKGHFPGETNVLRHWMYDVDSITGNEQIVKDIYIAQSEKIRKHFEGDPNFLELQLERGDGWFELVNFLGKENIGGFPKRNTGSARQEKKSRKSGKGGGRNKG